jgi:serine/threonine-protein kinase
VASRPHDDLTISPDLSATRTSAPSGEVRLHESHPHGAFAPGAIIAGRYRLIALLGRGGMGEVYRADDLTLDQPVALKFLPAGVAADPGRLAQFHNELRIARQVSHKNVCRLYDLGEADGRRFLTMEYVDGEDLASLLRRIGRIPQDKAIDIARQLCAGLAAAHERGVLHRDLKPANVMIDGDGNVRLTDFGLAVVEGDTAASRAGTPQYMAPEQLRGDPPSIRTDIYALGLVLFELFTGRRVFDAKTFPELLQLHEAETLTPSSVVRDLDPAVERAIVRCLERDPAKRPATALSVAAALPGSDPLAAALAAGETPSPELLIAAGERSAIPLPRALAVAGAALVFMAAFLVFGTRTSIPALVPLDKPPAVLIDHIQQMTSAFGYPDTPADAAFGFSVPPDAAAWVESTSTRPDWWGSLAAGSPPALVFWYRTSPRPLVPQRPVAHVTPTDPPSDAPAMREVITDTQGRLVEFHAAPPQFDAASTPAPPPDWKTLFDAAGLDMAAFHPVAPEWNPRDFADTRQAWEGPAAGRSDVRVRIEAAAYRGRPSSFSIVGPWTRPSRMEPVHRSTLQVFSGILVLIVWNLAVFGAALLAWRHVRAHRADTMAATRLTVTLFAGFTIGWLLAAHHTSDPQVELGRFVVAVGLSLINVAQAWVLYVAIEPYARRYWPDGLLGWSRLMSGRLRDSRVGHDLLAGAAVGGLIALAELGRAVVPPLVGGRATAPPFGTALTALASSLNIPLDGAQVLYNSLESALLIAVLFVILRLITRHPWAAVALVVLLVTMMSDNGKYVTTGWSAWIFGLTIISIITVCVYRFGLLVTGVALFFDNVLTTVPLAPPTRWWATEGTTAVLLLVGLIAWGFYAARAGEPLFGTLLPHE